MLLTLVLITIVIFNNTNSNESNIISNTNKDKQVINNNMITMMYETDAGTGIYEETKDTTWPESGYIFNENLSGCENGGELEYNSINKTVNLLSNKSDRCYVYFDKYDGVWIDNVSVTNVTGSSVTLNVGATSENGSITTYYYALNDSEEYIESTTNPIVINDLNKLTEYKISIYAIDSTNAKSNIYEISVSTTDESKPVINSVEVSDITYNGFTLTVNATSDVEIKRYYYIIESNNISGTNTNNSYIFTGLGSETSYDIVVFIENVNSIYSNKFIITVKTDELPTFLTEVCKSGDNLASCITNFYDVSGTELTNIYYHISSLANGAADNSYRYAGANPNNYVCFGSEAIPCPSDNLYRIVGVFGLEVKLIKNTSIGNYQWDSELNNTWNSRTKPDIRNTLNTTFLNTISSTWQEKIATHEFKVGGMSYSNGGSTPRIAYNYEVGANSSSTTDRMKIGLMYVSDYGYAASNSYWTTELFNYDSAADDNWMYLGSEWTISRRSDGYNYAFPVISGGYIGETNSVGNMRAVRPCFYLNSNVTYVSGFGTQSDPIRIQ